MGVPTVTLEITEVRDAAGKWEDTHSVKDGMQQEL